MDHTELKKKRVRPRTRWVRRRGSVGVPTAARIIELGLEILDKWFNPPF
jgi:hypothetical protein